MVIYHVRIKYSHRVFVVKEDKIADTYVRYSLLPYFQYLTYARLVAILVAVDKSAYLLVDRYVFHIIMLLVGYHYVVEMVVSPPPPSPHRPYHLSV